MLDPTDLEVPYLMGRKDSSMGFPSSPAEFPPHQVDCH